MVPIKNSTLCSSSPELSLLETVSTKWAPLVILALEEKKLRHGELQRAIGVISQKVLTQTLRALERDGVVTRHVYPVVPPHVEYELTPSGVAVISTIKGFGNWAREHYAETAEARKVFEAAIASRRTVQE
ncbi:MAG TPA: helix-turn-helix domain-containing protein [Patescibacteria group bacterium]|nr:helix-turn-helix domain-containing protein [Patescibacteria group bacterium]